MTQKIFKDGMDKFIIISRIISVNNSNGDQTPVFGSSGNEPLSSIFSNLSAYWFNPGTSQEVKITGITWNSNLGMWKARISSENIYFGTGWLSIAGQTADGTESIIPLSIEVEIEPAPIRRSKI